MKRISEAEATRDQIQQDQIKQDQLMQSKTQDYQTQLSEVKMNHDLVQVRRSSGYDVDTHLVNTR